MYLVNIWWFILGIGAGSAANAIIDRLPKNISWMHGRSKCDHCDHPLAWYDLIPLLSFLTLGGKCRYCHKTIPIRNFLLELAMGVGFVLLSYSWHLVAMLWLTMAIAVMDWETQLVSELLVLIWGVLVISQLSITTFHIPIFGLISAILVIGGLWAATRGRGMGFGDVEIAAVLGLWIGWPKIWLALLLAFVIGALVGLIKIGFKKSQLKSEMAFGPFLILGGWIAYLWGDMIWKALYGF